MKSTIELLLAAEVIKRAELLLDRAAGAFANKERKAGSELTTDVLRAQFRKENPWRNFAEIAKTEMEEIAELIGNRPAA